MDITTILHPTLSPQQKQAPVHLNELKDGTKLSGRVIQTDLEGMVLIDFGNFRATAKIAFPVDKGQILDFVLAKTGGQVTLTVALPNVQNSTDLHLPNSTAPSQTVGRFEILSDQTYKELLADIQTLLNKNMTLPEGQKIPPNIQHILEKINAFFKPAGVGPDIANLASQIKAFVEDSGVFFEKKIEQAINNLMRTSLKVSAEELAASSDIKQIISKDLKPNLLILKNYFADPEVTAKLMNQKGLLRLQGAVEQLLANVYQQQDISINRPNDPDMLQIFSYALPFQDSDQKSRIKVYYPKKKVEQKKGSHRVSLLLEMDRLGTVRADLVPVNKDLNITFFVQREESRQLIENNYTVLTDALETTFNNFFLNAMVSEKKIDRFTTEDYGSPSDRQIDIKA